MSEIVPFLKAVAGATSKPLGSALPRIATPEVSSPWSPTATQPAVQAELPKIDVEAITAKAIEDGRAEGLRETEALRAKLAQLIGELAVVRDAYVAPATELIADAAASVVEGWVVGSDRKALFAPLIEAWISGGAKTARACCHPDDAEALRAAIGEAAITVETDPTIKRGNLVIADATRELAQAWEPRLRELREAIAGALVES